MIAQKGIGTTDIVTLKVEKEECGLFDEVITHLKNCQLFSELTNEQIKKLAAVFEITDYEAGDYIFRQGELGDKLYVIERGLVNLQRKVNLGNSDVYVSISFLGPYRLLGCWACLLGEYNHHTESAICQKPTRVITAKASELKDILRSDLYITILLLMQLCYMLGDKVNGVYSAMESL